MAKRRTRRLENLESRELLAGVLVGQWLAEDLSGQLGDGAPVTNWTDKIAGTIAAAVGGPKFVAGGYGGRGAIRFDPTDGDDALTVGREESPVSRANDFSVVVAFASSSNNLVGGQAEWYKNTGLVDGNNLGLSEDWGLSINSSGQVSAGISGGFSGPARSVYTPTGGLNDGGLHIATLTRSGSTISLYVDQQPAVTRADASAAQRGRLGLSIGRLYSGQLPFSGDIAEVRVYNGALAANEVATVTSEVRSYYANSAPVPVDDHYSLDEDTPFFIVPAPGVLGNDQDADGDALRAELVTSTAHGHLVLQPSGGIIYDSDANFFGTDSFTYRTVDFRGSEQFGTVTLEVRPTYDAAQPVADTYKAVPSQRLVVGAAAGVLANDSNLDQALLTAVLASDVTAGRLTLSPVGSFEYDPQGFAGIATFRYQINDQTRLSAAQTVTLIVNSVPDAAADTFATDEDTRLVRGAAAGVLANDADADGDSLSVTLVKPPLHGTLTLNADGSLEYVPETDYHGPDGFSYQVSDTVDTSAATLVQLTVRSVNDPPVAVDDSYFALPGEPLAVPVAAGLLRNDQDVDHATLVAELVSGPANGTLQLAADGSFTYHATAGFIGTDSFRYRARDAVTTSATVTATLTVTPRPVAINELMASNAETITTMVRKLPTDEFVGEQLTPDWIELRNYLAQPVDVGLLHLTDDPADRTKWQFPAGTVIPASGYLLVFASGRDIRDTRLDQLGALHTNFQLNDVGEYLSVTGPAGEPIDVIAGYPQQRVHLSYGFDDQGNANYYTAPTPAAANNVGLAGLVADTQFSVDRGFFREPVTLEISSATRGAEIRYTIDGSVPDVNQGIVYSGPLTIDRTTTLRARAFLDGLVPTNVDTHSYFFLADVVEQDSAATQAAGFPASWRGTAPDYGLDSEDQFPLIAGDTNLSVDAAKQAIQDSLLALPTLSIVLDIDDMFGADQGIYTNPQRTGPAWERPTSVELIRPDGSEGFQIDSGIRIQGGAFRDYGLTKKKSFRLLFKSTYGDGRLNYPLFGPDANDEIATLTLRMEANDGWQWGDAGGQPQYARDEFLRRTQLAMQQPSSHGTHVQLYINGMYWGLYNVVERPDESMGEAYFGSYPYDWDGQNSGTATNADGDRYRSDRSRDAWRTLTTLTDAIRTAATEGEKTAAYLTAQGLNPDGSDNLDLPRYLDPVNYADYLIANYYGGNNDWPHKNYYFGRENSPDSDGFKFFMWDAEWSLFLRSNQGASLINNYAGVADPLRDLRTSQEFRLLFADRVHKHFFNGGALYVDPQNPQWDPAHPERNLPAARYVEVADIVYPALIAESARWGDQHRARPYTRDVEWQREFDNLMAQWFPRRTFELLDVFRSLDLYPQTDVPTFSQRGGAVTSSTDLTLASPAGTIYYTLDGSDPRSIGGAVGPTAVRYTGPFRLADSTQVRVRALDGTSWSAIDEAQFLVDAVPASSDNLRVSEVHYHPLDASGAEIAAGFVDADEFEFIELANISNQTIDLSNVRLAQMAVGGELQGIEFDFASGQVRRLAPGARVLVVENLAAFQVRYGDQLPVAGQWSGGLSNAGEALVVMAGDAVLQQFVYDDGWYPASDGAGASLEQIDIAAADLDRWNLAESWRPSGLAGGTPGRERLVNIPGDANHDGVFNSSDLVAVLQLGEYEDGLAGNSSFDEGDWNGDGDFDTSDLVFVFQQANYLAELALETLLDRSWGVPPQ